MVKHVVFWSLKEQADGYSRSENAQRMKQQLEALKASIPEILELEVGINLEKCSYDVGLYSVFEDENTLKVYQEHPEHQKVKEFIAKVRNDSAAFDYKIQ